MENEKTFTMDELNQFDGKNGKPAYVAFKGKICDVTDSYMWINGDHSGEHQAGKDLTEEMMVAPHSEDVMERSFLGSASSKKLVSNSQIWGANSIT